MDRYDYFQHILAMFRDIAERKFKFYYNPGWGEGCEVILRENSRGLLMFDFGDPDENLLLEDADDHLMRAAYIALRKAFEK